MYMLLIPSQSLYLLHESLCSMPNPLELLKSQLTACIEQALRLLAVKTFFCAALQLFRAALTIFSGRAHCSLLFWPTPASVQEQRPTLGLLMASFTM